MRRLLPLLLTIVVPFSTVGAQNLDPGKLVGGWSGTGTFFNAELQKKVGALPFVFHIAPDRSGTGRVGAAELQDVHVKPTRDYIEVRARLTRPVAADPALAKERLVLVVTALSDSTIEAEFHLKTNFVFDMRMRDGRVVLTRVP
jgi:hypothetical protein